MQVSTEDVLRALAFVLGRTYECDESGNAVFNYREVRLLPLPEETISAVARLVGSYEEVDECAVATKDSYEVLISTDRRMSLRGLREGMVLDDLHSGVTYKVGLPSAEYAVYIALRLRELPDARPHRLNRVSSYVIQKIFGLDEPVSVLEVVRQVMREFSLSITSRASRHPDSWKQLADAYSFHLSYNLDAAFMPHRNLHELVRPLRISRVRRATLDELDAPRRVYVPDLVYHYQLGVSSESPMLEYISYYHVAEHYFESIYQDDLIEQVQDSITAPRFSYRRKADVQKLIRKISKAVQLRDEQMIINEQVALRLTLEKHVDLDQLVADLDEFDSSLVDYYAKSSVGFSKGDAVALRGADPSNAFGALSRRIYKTRNALVHSKDGVKNRFVPFADDKELVPEVPLMRFIAEQIIINTSQLHSP